MKVKTVTPVLVLVLFSTVAGDTVADSYRCGRKVVRDGDPVSHLLKICGEPRFKDSGSSMIKVDGVKRKTRVQRWHYKKSSRSLEHVVLIHGGKIAAIEVGGR